MEEYKGREGKRRGQEKGKEVFLIWYMGFVLNCVVL